MPTLVAQHPAALGLKAGEWVQVRNATEILATLDERGQLDALPFMPEMLPLCGRRFRVASRADKTCDTIGNYKSRRMSHAVHLENVRCDGAAHGGCEAGCLIFWKEAWLQRASETEPSPSVASEPAPAAARERLVPLTRRAASAPEAEPVYVCQSTELQRATTPLRWWDPRQYVRELRSGNVRPVRFARTLARAWLNAVRRRFAVDEQPHIPVRRPRIRWWDPSPYLWQLRAGRVPLGMFVRALRGAFNGTHTSTASSSPAPAPERRFQAGDRVRVRPLDEIAATLGPNQRHKGLWFDVEMVPFCGGEYRVLRRVQQIIDERTGRMMRMKHDCLILEGVACGGCLSRDRLFCPRALFPFWREAWLEPAE